jgi:predicted MFS family arabinose efflux permease
MTTMAAEFAPPRYANFAVGFVQAGWPFGSIITAFTAAKWLPAHTWQSMLLGIGCVSVGLLVLMWMLLPESLSFLALKRSACGGTRVAPTPLAAVAALFKDGRGLPSALLWTAVTLGYFALYFVISWIPKLVTQAGLPLSQAIYAGATYNLGAFMGTAAVGWIAVRVPLHRVVATSLGLAAVTLLVFGGFAMPVWLTLMVALCVGMTVQGGFNGFWALSARLYPADMRNTGVGWALGVGRIGAVLGPIVGGLLVGAHVSLPVIFAIFAASVAAAAALTLRIQAR